MSDRDFETPPQPEGGLFKPSDIERCIDDRIPEGCVGMVRPDGLIQVFYLDTENEQAVKTGLLLPKDKPMSEDKQPATQKHMTEGDAIAVSLQAIKVARGDILLVEVEGCPPRMVRSFRRELGERLKEAGMGRKDVCSIVVQKGTVEITRITTDHLKSMERRIEELEVRLRGVSKC